MVYHHSLFDPTDAPDLAAFLNDLRQNHWSLTSLAYQRQPDAIPLATPETLIQAEAQPTRIGTFLLRHNGRIISILRLDDKFGDGKIAVFSGVETHPDYQRRGTFWRHLLNPCLRRICAMGYQRLEAVTWPFNRKGIPFYKRVGYRAVPGTSLLMENYFPSILRLPALQTYFARHDYIRALRNERSYGYDSLVADGLEVFAYQWSAQGEEWGVHIDWRRKQIAAIQRPDWAVRCFVVDEFPFRIRCQLENRQSGRLSFAVGVKESAGERPRPQTLNRDAVVTQEIEIADPPAGLIPSATIRIDINGLPVEFPIARFHETEAAVIYPVTAEATTHS